MLPTPEPDAMGWETPAVLANMDGEPKRKERGCMMFAGAVGADNPPVTGVAAPSARPPTLTGGFEQPFGPTHNALASRAPWGALSVPPF